MEIDQIVYEYGKLQLNFVACQRQSVMLSQQLAQVNKTVGALTQDKGKALARVTQLEAIMKANNIGLPLTPEPESEEPDTDPKAPGPALVEN